MQGPILWQQLWQLELYEGQELMPEKKFVDSYGATTATTLRLTAAYHGTGRIIVTDWLLIWVPENCNSTDERGLSLMKKLTDV